MFDWKSPSAYGIAERPQSSETAINCCLGLNCTHQENKWQAVITKVNELNSSFCCQKNVIPLDITVDDLVIVQMLKALHGVPPPPNNRKRERENLNGYFKTITPPLKIQSTSTFGYTSLLLYTLHITDPFPLVTMQWWSNQLQIAPSDVIPSQMDVLTKRAPYKMYEIIASSNRWPHLSRPLTSSVTEPPLHNCKRRCKERGTAGEHIQKKKKKKKTLRRKADYWPDVVNL